MPRALILIALILAWACGAFGQAQGWYAPLAQWALAWRAPSLRDDAPRLYLDIDFQDAQRLQAERARGQADGVRLARPGDAVTATLRMGSDTLPTQIRLPPGDALSGEWAFDLTVLGGRRLLGWQQVTLYPAEAPQVFRQWGLSASLRRNGILAVPVEPVQVVLNGDALGLYAASPAPDAGWLAQQGRTSGRLLNFDRTQYWRELGRQRGNSRTPLTSSEAACQMSNLVLADSPDSQQDRNILALWRDVQSGRRAASDLFDAERMGALLALSALWQGAPLDDWSRLTFYQEPTTGKLEPLATAEWLLAARPDDARWSDCLDDPLIQAALVRALEKISRSDYARQVQAELGTVPAAALPAWDELASSQQRIARWLEPAQAVWATWAVSPTTPLPTIQVSVANLERVPVKVLGLDVGKGTFLPIEPGWVQPSPDALVPAAPGQVILRAVQAGRARRLHLIIPYEQVLAGGRAFDEPLEVRVVTHLWGTSRQQSAPAQFVGGE